MIWSFQIRRQLESLRRGTQEIVKDTFGILKFKIRILRIRNPKIQLVRFVAFAKFVSKEFR